MFKKILLFLICVFSCSNMFAVDCQNMDEKFVKVDTSKIGTDMYDKNTRADKIEKSDYLGLRFNGLYNGGRWGITNKKDKSFNVTGLAICIDNNGTLDFKNINQGQYCWCNVESIDNYQVASKWHNVKEYNRHIFDENKYKDKPNLAQQKEKEAKEFNIQDCMNGCAASCQTKKSELIRGIYGYYICEKALYKLQNVKCEIDRDFINAVSISVFDDIAEIKMLDGNIVFTRENQNDFNYVGKYDDEPVYLKVKNNSIYVGRQNYSMQECL